MGRHKNIELLSYSEVEKVSGYVGNYKIRVRRKPRYIEEDLCTGCGKCAEVCPIDVPNAFDFGYSQRKVSYRDSAQSVPNAFTIEKRGIAPCRDACPTDQRAQGYIALVRERRFADAYWAIRREHPFPSVCGRVCNHLCEDACSRGKVDDPVNIMGIKRFIADWAYENRESLATMRDKSLVGTPFEEEPASTGKRIAIIGAGPAGLTAGLDLVRLGHSATVFDSLPVAGGMMRVGIPPHRLPLPLLDWEIQQILDEGVRIELNTWIDDVPGLLEQGFDAALIATGAHRSRKIPIRNSNHRDNWESLDFLRRVALDDAPSLAGKRIVVLGGGNVALDTARAAIRLGQPTVRMACLEPRGEMPGFAWEIGVAEEEGVRLFPGRTFKEIVVENDHLIGVRCVQVDFHGFKRGRPIMDEIPGTEHILPADIVIWAVGQGPDFSFLPEDGSINTRYPVGIETDDEMMTTMPGVFCAGDVRRGMTFFVVDAIAEGHHAARCMDRYLRGEAGVQEAPRLPVVELRPEDVQEKIAHGHASDRARTPIECIPINERQNNFREVDLTLSEAQVVAEAERCVRCGICSECLECVAVCERGAIHHEMQPTILDLEVGTIILATGFDDFDPSVATETGYGRLDNVITGMEFERLINTSGPTMGKVLLKNGKPPRKVAVLHCIGSRDDRYHEYCSRVCCMYSLKLAQLVHEYVDAEVVEVYRDMRTFGKGYEEFFNRTDALGVQLTHGRLKSVSQQGDQLLVEWDENYYNEPDRALVDMVILATGFEPRKDTAEVAGTFGISRSKDGFFLERHPKLAPVETSTAGIFLAGACQSPKDIPDSVAQAGAAAAAALSLIDRGRIALDPSSACVDASACAGCGQCAQACPYAAIEIVEGTARVNAYLCKGCGTCAAACPNKAMTLIHYDDRQLLSELTALLRLDTSQVEVA